MFRGKLGLAVETFFVGKVKRVYGSGVFVVSLAKRSVFVFMFLFSYFVINVYIYLFFFFVNKRHRRFAIGYSSNEIDLCYAALVGMSFPTENDKIYVFD